MFGFLKYFSYVLVLIGAINWGFVGLFDFDLVAMIFGDMTFLSRTIYVLVGISAIISVVTMYIGKKHHNDLNNI